MLEDDTSRRDGSIVGTERCVPFNFGGHSKRVLTHSSDNLRTNASDSVNASKQLSNNNASYSALEDRQRSDEFDISNASWPLKMLRFGCVQTQLANKLLNAENAF